MVNIDTNEIRAAIANRVATDWSATTVADMATSGTYFQPGDFTPNESPNEYVPRAIGFGNFDSEIRKTTKDTSFNFTHDIVYSGGAWKAIAAFMGVIDTPTTVSGQVKKHVLDMASTSSGSSSIAYTIESDKVIEIPNVAWSALEMDIPNADVGTITLEGIGDFIVVPDDADTTANELETLFNNRPLFDPATWADCDSYFRVGPYSTTSGLSASDDQEVLNVNFRIERPLEQRYVQRGCDSAATQKPRVAGKNTGTLTFQLGKQLTSDFDLLNHWHDGTKLMAELVINGPAISGSFDRQIKIQFPYLEIVDFPEGLDASGGADSLIEPTVTCRVLQAPAAPSGMAGVTNYLRIPLQNVEAGSYLQSS